MVKYKHIRRGIYMKSYNPEKGSYDMGMFCNQQNKKEVKRQKKLLNLFVVLIIKNLLCYDVINFKNILSCFLENRQAN